MSEPMLRNGEANVEGTPPCSEHGRAPDEEAVEIERAEAPLPAAENLSADGSSYNAYTRVVPPPAEPSAQLMYGPFGCCFGPPEAVLGKARRLACCDLLLTPYFYGGWIVQLVHVVTVVGYAVFTPAHRHPWLMAVVGVLFVVSVFLLCKSQCIDPGVVPRGRVSPDFPTGPNLVGSHVGTKVNGLLVGEHDYVGLVGTGDTLVVWRWCQTCLVHRPPRAAHCSVCGWCVKEYDHHCPVVGCCVAERTFRYFTLLLLLLAAQCLVVFVSSAYFVFQHDWDDAAGTDVPALTVFAMFASGLVACMSGCWTFSMGTHYLTLSCKDMTLREEVRGLAHKKRSNGCRNCTTRLCGPETPATI